MSKEEILAEFLIELSCINIIEDDLIEKVKTIVKKYFEADNCIWHRTREEQDYFELKSPEFSNNLKRAKIVLLKSSYGDETFMIINPKISYELEEYLIPKLQIIISNLSRSEFSISGLKEGVMTDALTGVGSVESFNRLLKSKVFFQDVGVCFIDVNGLGVINNVHGHEAGDKMLVTFSLVMKKYMRKSDIYRKGGDEFVIVCEDIDEEQFKNRIDYIKNDLAFFGYSASFGLVYRKYTDDLNQLVSLADELMYVEKEQYRKNNPDKYHIGSKR